MQHIGVSDRRQLRSVSPLTHWSVPVSPPCSHTSGPVLCLYWFCTGSAGWSSDSFLSSTINVSAADTTLKPSTTHNASVSPGRRSRHSSSSSSPLVYSILVEDKQVTQVTDYLQIVSSARQLNVRSNSVHEEPGA